MTQTKTRRTFLKTLTRVTGLGLILKPSSLVINNIVLPIVQPLVKTPCALTDMPAMAPRSQQAPTVIVPKQRLISLYNIHTSEWLNGFDIDALTADKHLQKQLSVFFRDFRVNEKHVVDPRLMKVLHHIAQNTTTKNPIHLVSGYRSQKTNQQLQEVSTGVASKSYHTRGMAADVFIEGVDNRTIQKIALAQKAGGVGRYQHFVHIDTGRVRRWGMKL